MGYIEFDKSKLVNLEYSLGREILRTSRSGSYSSTTIAGCNTRKYHGLLVSPVDNFDGERHVLLSSLDVSVVPDEKVFNIGLHKFMGEHSSPRGHKSLKDFKADPVPSMKYEVGAVKLKQERVMSSSSDQLMIRYTIEDAPSAVKLQFRPLLAFRRIHDLTFSNLAVNRRVEDVKNGIRIKMYDGFPWLNMQLSRKGTFVPAPDWIYGIEYPEEQKRGYDFKEDLYVPGFFEIEIKPGDSVIFSAATEEVSPAGLGTRFTKERNIRIPRDSFRNCLVNSAQQFIVRRNGQTDIIAGYHWFGTWGRDTFISVPGLTLSRGETATFREVVDTQVSRMQGGLFPNMGTPGNPAFNSVDAPLWFIWAVQQYHLAGEKDAWERYGKPIAGVVEAYIKGTSFGIRMDEGGLIYAGSPGKALTWMDAVVAEGPVTPREGYNVEINALWYNALMFILEVADPVKDSDLIKLITPLPARVKDSFNNLFWHNIAGYPADYVTGDGDKNMDVRPNMVIALSLPHRMVDRERGKLVLDRAEKELLTPRGLRTLSPKNPDYHGTYRGSQAERDNAYHQGTVWPWLAGPYCEAYLRLYGEGGVKHVKSVIARFEEVMAEHGISSVSEVYDGDPPHSPGGTISQAWSVAEILRIMDLTDQVLSAKKGLP